MAFSFELRMKGKSDGSATEMDPGKPGKDMIAVLCVVIALLVIIVTILIAYIAVLKWKKGRRRRSERDVERPTSFSHHATSSCIISRAVNSMMDFRLQGQRPYDDMKVNPAFVPDSQEKEVSASSHEQNIAPERQLDVLTPDSCGSGRIDSELFEMQKTDMTESVTVEVDSKLLVFMSKEMDDTGGTLVLDKMGITLLVPPCAIPRGKKQIIQLVLDWDLSDFPPMTDAQTIISPVVHCGPHGLKLAKPAILSFMHCADSVDDIKVLSSETHLMHDKHWRPLQHRKSCGKVEYALLENQCQVYLSHFSLYTCIAEGSLPKLTKKWIQLAAFGKREGGQFQVFIYMLNNTPCALQFATQQQAKYNCSMLRCPLEFLIDEEGGDLIFDLKHLTEGWSPAGRKWNETGLFPDIWQGKCNNISFTFKHDNPACADLSFNICLFQKDLADVKRHFEVALSFQTKKPTRRTQQWLHPQTNFNLNLSNAVPSVLINGFDSGISTTASETTSFRSVMMDHYPVNHHEVGTDEDKDDHPYDLDMVVTNCCGDGDQAYYGSDDSDEDDDEAEDTNNVASPSQETRNAIGATLETKTRERRSRTYSGNTTNINIHTETIVKPPASLERRPTSHDPMHDPPSTIFPLRLRSKLVALLDPPSPIASSINDWRLLAESLSLDSMVSLIRTKPSPTEELLNYAAQQRKDCRWLHDVLRDAERYDAADEVAKFLNNESGESALKQNMNNLNGDEDEVRYRVTSISESIT